MANLSENFSEEEFRCRCGCGLLILHPGFIQRLEAVRMEIGAAMHVTSGCRCKAYNDRPALQGGVGGHPKSLHVCDFAQYPGQEGTLAADIIVTNGHYRGRLFTVAWSAGFSIGWNAKKGFLHLDRRDLIGLSQTSFDY